MDKLKDISHRNQYQQVLDSKLTEITYNENAIVDEQWKVIKETVMEVAKQTVGEKIGKRNEEWFDEECREVIKQKNTDRLQMLQKKTRLASEKYKESRKKATKIIRNKKKVYIKKEIETIETLNNQNENRKFYQAVKKINNGFQSRLVICKDKNGNVIGNNENILNRWVEHFEEMLNGKDEEQNIEVREYITVDQEIRIPDELDVEMAIEKQRNNRAPGEDSLTAELFKYGGRKLIQTIHKLVIDIWENEKMPRNGKLA